MDAATSKSHITYQSEKTLRTDTEFQETLITVPPDGGWGWVVVVGAFFSFAIVDGLLYSFGLYMDSMEKDLQCSKSEISTCAAIFTAIYCFNGPFVASMVNNYGYRIVGVTGSAISIISYLITSVSKSIYLIYFTYGVIGGFGFGMIYMPAVIAVGFYFQKWRGVATGISSCGAGLGGIALPVIMTLILEKVGWRQTFRVIAALLVMTVFSAMLFKPILPTQTRRIKLSTAASGNFFSTYHNRMYPTLSEISEVPTITLLQPRKLNKSSEVMIMTYPSSSLKFKWKDEENAAEESIKQSQTGSDFNKSREKTPHKHMTTLFATKKRKIPLHETHTSFGASNMRPMYRDDIFYNSSFNFLQKCQIERYGSQKSGFTNSKSSPDYHLSVIRAATSKDLNQGKKCNICTEAVKRTLATMLDYNLLKSPSFLLIALNALFECFGYFTTYLFIKDKALKERVPEDIAFWLISMIGVANTVGRMLYGMIGNWFGIEYTWLSACCLLIGGTVTICSVHFTQVEAHIAYAFIYGGLVACIPALRTLIVVETLGLEKLTNSVGLILMFQGVATLAGITTAGALREYTGDYKLSFYLSGSAIIIGGLCLMPLKAVAKWEKSKDRYKENKRNVTA